MGGCSTADVLGKPGLGRQGEGGRSSTGMKSRRLVPFSWEQLVAKQTSKEAAMQLKNTKHSHKLKKNGTDEGVEEREPSMRTPTTTAIPKTAMNIVGISIIYPCRHPMVIILGTWSDSYSREQEQRQGSAPGRVVQAPLIDWLQIK